MARRMLGRTFCGFAVSLTRMAALCLVVVLTRACSTEPLGSSAGAINSIYGATSDSDDSFANVAVKLIGPGGSCTGVLITPTTVLTAAHCINGSASPLPVESGIGTPITVEWGNGSDETIITTDGKPFTAVAGPITSSIDDVALVFANITSLNVDAAVQVANSNLSSAGWDRLLGTYISRPETPSHLATVQAVGWDEQVSIPPGRQVALVPGGVVSEGGLLAFEYGLDSKGTCDGKSLLQPGDSGGPLFVTNANGPTDLQRHIVGIASGGGSGAIQACANLWVPVGPNPKNDDWISLNAVDHSHDAQPNWLKQHPFGGVGSRWRGEVDYLGPCDTVHDQDCDHWYDSDPVTSANHDNCPQVFNPDQTDEDDDTLGDACDGKHCPCDDGGFDVDGDRVCQRPCPGQLGSPDNCAFTPNADQFDCNLDFEIANASSLGNLAIMGDACDPVPCPRPQTRTLPLVAGGCAFPPFNGAGCVPNPPPAQNSKQCCGTALSNEVVTTTIGSHVANVAGPVSAAVEVNVPPSTDPKLGVAGTLMRYCQQSPPIDCGDSSVLNETMLKTDSLETAIPLDKAHPWHKVHVASTNQPYVSSFDPIVTNLTYGVSGFRLDWLYDKDLTAWLNAGAITGCSAAADPTCLVGRWWNSADSQVGTFSDETVSGQHVGYHVSGNDFGNIGDGIVPMQPVRTTLWCPVPVPLVNLDPTGPLGWGPGKLVVLPHAPSPQLDATLVTGDTRFLGASAAANVIVALQADGSGIAAQDIGASDCGGNQVDDSIRSITFAGTSTWLNAVEPAVSIPGQPFDAVALSLDGTTVVATARTIGTKLTTNLSNPTGGDPPAPRGAYGAAYSRWAGGIFIAGGISTADASVLHDVWFTPPNGPWSNVTPHASGGAACGGGLVREIGTIRALTYSYGDSELWMIDEPTKLPFVRLLRAAPSGGIEQLATWPKHGDSTGYFLSVDHDGAVLVSLVRKQGFVVARVEPQAGCGRVTGLYNHADDVLLGPTFVSPVGYGFFVDHHGTGEVLRTATIPRLPASRAMSDSP